MTEPERKIKIEIDLDELRIMIKTLKASYHLGKDAATAFDLVKRLEKISAGV